MSKINLVFKKTLVAHALTLAFSVGVVSVGISQSAMAQSNASATIFGTVKAGAGTSVELINLETGLKKSEKIGANGRFSATALPAGRYSATLMNGATKVKSIEIEALAGQGSEAAFSAVDATPSGTQTVQVSARRTRIDVSNSTNGATFTAKELGKLPIAQNIDAIIQLAPNTTRADSRYAGGASFGGGGASENAYYINGFPVTNPLTQLGASELPFGAIGQAQILTGGFGAEFGRSIGGVVNITTKSGTNNWEMGATASFSPKQGRSKPKNLYYANTGAPENALTDGQLRVRREENTLSQTKVGAYVGGPIIKDTLFMFVAAEATRTQSEGVVGSTASSTNLTNGWDSTTGKLERYTAKIDWNINDDHRLEFTAIGDTPKADQASSGYDYQTKARVGGVTSTAHYQNVDNQTAQGANVNILKYTGNLTNDLTLTALYGKMKADHSESFGGADLSKFQIIAPLNTQVPGLTYANPNPVGGRLLAPGAKEDVSSFRLDLEYKLGNHTLRAGLDDNKLTSLNAGETQSGGGSWTYFRTATPNTPIVLQNVRKAVASGGGFGTDGYYVRRTIFNDATTAYSNQQAQYLEDRWQITKNVLFTMGIRDEQFTNLNGDKVPFLEMKNQIAPRFSLAWDVNGDASMKVFSSLGRYHVQIPTHLAVRGASRSTFTRQSFTYTGVDANGAPIGLVALNEPYSSNNEYGQAKDALTVSAVGMKPTYQDEITLGFEKAFSPTLNFGAKGTYRDMKTTIDDLCDSRPFSLWLAAHPTVDSSNWGGFGCASFNPGEDNDFLVDFAGTGKNHTLVHLTKEMIGMPKAERKYTAIDLFAEHPLRNGWYGKINYTWSRSKGNTEGQTLSDVAQTDVAATQTWDVKEIMENRNGLLPNDRTHQLKAYGFYEISPQITVGGNLLLSSGRPKNCIGNHPNATSTVPGVADEFANYDYGSAYGYCNGQASPRGTTGNLQWDKRVDLNLVYQPTEVKGLALKLDMFNIFNNQNQQTIDEVYNSAESVSSTYGRTLSYTAPSSLKFTVEYNHKF